MSDVLSQNEIDNLLSDMSSGTVDVDDLLTSQTVQGEITNYDFRRPNRISKNQVRTLQNIHESFAETFGYYLVSKLQTVVSISVTSVDQLFYSEFILSVSNPSCLYVFDIEGTDGSGILEISPQLALTLMERLLGGTSDTQEKSRTITPIEQAVVRGIIEHTFSDLRNAWKAIADMNFQFSRLEMEADFVQIAPASEIVVVISFDVNIGTQTFLMNICFPTFALEEVLAQLAKQQITTSATKVSDVKIRENMRTITRHMESTHLPVKAILGQTKIAVYDLLELNVGDVLKLDKRINEEIEVLIGTKQKLAARPGTLDGKKAVRVIRPLKDEDIVDLDLYYKETE
jgi:flagellar motor switch protein FliM